MRISLMKRRTRCVLRSGWCMGGLTRMKSRRGHAAAGVRRQVGAADAVVGLQTRRDDAVRVPFRVDQRAAVAPALGLGDLALPFAERLEALLRQGVALGLVLEGALGPRLPPQRPRVPPPKSGGSSETPLGSGTAECPAPEEPILARRNPMGNTPNHSTPDKVARLLLNQKRKTELRSWRRPSPKARVLPEQMLHQDATRGLSRAAPSGTQQRADQRLTTRWPPHAFRHATRPCPARSNRRH